MFRVKICGITNERDAALAVSAGAEAIGLNFVPGTPRFLTVDKARAVTAAIDDSSLKVGVFANSSIQDIALISQEAQLDAVQLHGDESPDFLGHLSKIPLIRAFRCGKNSVDEIASYLAACGQLGCSPAAVIIDAYHPKMLGGTGQTLHWPEFPTIRRALPGLRLILAGGLKPDNVLRAIQTLEPDGVDTASGVESQPGVKDERLVQEFIEAAKKGFAAKNGC